MIINRVKKVGDFSFSIFRANKHFWSGVIHIYIIM